MDDVLTSDNIHLSRLKNPPAEVDFSSAVDCTQTLAEQTAGYVANSLARNTRRAYLSDLVQFEAWGGSIPAKDALVAAYLTAHAEKLSAATLTRRIASISKAHAASGFPNPTRSEIVRSTLRGIKRRHGKPQREAKPLLRDELFATLEAMADATLKDVRDRALLLVGFAGAFRRAELVAIDLQAVEFVPLGAVITIERSKTDQIGSGRKVGIPLGQTRHCPVRALETWISRSGYREGAVFRPIDKHGNSAQQRLSSGAVAKIVKCRVAHIGLDPARYSGHSLRAGFVTSAAQANVPSFKIRSQTGHASDAMLNRYIRDGKLFSDNAAAALL